MSSSAMLDLESGVEARRPARRAARRRAPGTRSVLAGASGGVPCRDDAVGACSPSRGHALPRSRTALATAQHAVRRGPSCDRDDEQELRAALVALGHAVGAAARARSTAVPDAGATVRGGLRPALRVGLEIAHLGSTLSRRRRIQRERRVKDRTIRRFMETAGVRLPRWFQTAERILEEQREIDERDEDETTSRRLRDRTASLVGSHPVIVGSFIGIVVGAVTIRFLFGAEALAGGVLPAFPAEPRRVLGRAGLGLPDDPLGGTLSASPALGALGGLSWLMLGSTSTRAEGGARRGPGAGGDPDLSRGDAAHRATRPVGAGLRRVRALRSHAVVLLGGPSRSPRRARGPAGDLRADRDRVRAPRSRRTGDGDSSRAWGSPWPCWSRSCRARCSPSACSSWSNSSPARPAPAASARWRSRPRSPRCCSSRSCRRSRREEELRSYHRSAPRTCSQLARLAPGGGPGTWVVALFLPVAALVSFALVGAELRGRAIRAVLVALVGLALSWLSAAWWVPAPLSNPLAYLAVAAVAEVMLVAYGVSSAVTGLGREAFGMRQILTAMLAIVIGGGLVLQSIAALVGGWAVGGPEQVPAAWSVLESTAKGDFRVLWVGSHTNDPFPAPGGDPAGLAEAGGATLRYGLTGRDGTVAIDIARPVGRPGPRSPRGSARRDPLGHDPPRRGAVGTLRRAVRDRGRRRRAAASAGAARRAGRPRPRAGCRSRRLPQRASDLARGGARGRPSLDRGDAIIRAI